MAKKQSVKKSLPKKSGGLSVFWNKHWQVILIAVLVVGILGFIGVNKLIIYNQKQQFDQAEKSLDTLYANIVKDVGQPTSMTKDRSCSYASTEGGRGRLGCGVGIVAKYDVTSASQANSMKNKVISQANSLHPTYSRGYDFVDNRNSSSFENPSITFSCSNNVSCGVSLDYTDPGDLSNGYIEPHQVIINLSAGGAAKAEFYPVKN